MYLKIRDLDLNYEIKGNGKPIVILHGYTVDHRLMSGCIEPILGESNEYILICLVWEKQRVKIGL